MTTEDFVPEHFVPPPPLCTEGFEFQVLGPEHNEQDQPAWTANIEHIRATPGFRGRTWPRGPDSLTENLLSLMQHRRDFDSRRGFAYAVLVAGQYVGCVYFYPPRSDEFDVDVRSWVRSENAALDGPLHDVVRCWLKKSWPWRRWDYARR
jgi:hypothetical protein